MSKFKDYGSKKAKRNAEYQKRENKRQLAKLNAQKFGKAAETNDFPALMLAVDDVAKEGKL